MKPIHPHHAIDMAVLLQPPYEQHQQDLLHIQRIVHVLLVVIVFRHRHHHRDIYLWIQFPPQFMPTIRIGKIQAAHIGPPQRLAVQSVCILQLS